MNVKSRTNEPGPHKRTEIERLRVIISAELVSFLPGLDAEEQRGDAESLSQEVLAVFGAEICLSIFDATCLARIALLNDLEGKWIKRMAFLVGQLHSLYWR